VEPSLESEINELIELCLNLFFFSILHLGTTQNTHNIFIQMDKNKIIKIAKIAKPFDITISEFVPFKFIKLIKIL
jgi:hypothetical protein